MEGNTLFVTDTYEYLYRGAPMGTGWTWSKLPLRGNIAIVRKGRYLFAAGSDQGDLKCSVFRSGDDGITWRKKAVGLPTDEQVMGGTVPLAVVGENLFISFYDEGIVYRSPDDGETWTPYAGRPGSYLLRAETMQGAESHVLRIE